MKKLYLILLIISGTIPLSFAQSGWTREKKNFFIKTSFDFYKSEDYRNLDAEKVITSEFAQKTLLIYAEYGLSNRLSLNTTFPAFRINGYNSTDNVSGIGDLRIELKYALLKDFIPVAVSIAPEFPIGNKNLFAKSNLNDFDEINLPTGDGEFNVWTTLAASHSFYPLPLYVSAFSSFNYRSKFEGRSFQNQLQNGIEVGYKAFNKLWLNTKVTTLSGIGKDPLTADFIRGDGTTYTGFSAGGLFEIGKHFGLNFQYYKAGDFIVKSRNIYAADIFSVGLTYSKKR